MSTYQSYNLDEAIFEAIWQEIEDYLPDETWAGHYPKRSGLEIVSSMPVQAEHHYHLYHSYWERCAQFGWYIGNDFTQGYGYVQVSRLPPDPVEWFAPNTLEFGVNGEGLSFFTTSLKLELRRMKS